MSGVLCDIKSVFGDDKSFYDILNIRKEATKDEGKCFNDAVIHSIVCSSIWYGCTFRADRHFGPSPRTYEMNVAVLVWLLRTQDTSAPRHFGPVNIIGLECRFMDARQKTRFQRGRYNITRGYSADDTAQIYKDVFKQGH